MDERPNKGMKLTRPGGGERGVGALQLIPGVRQTTEDGRKETNTANECRLTEPMADRVRRYPVLEHPVSEVHPRHYPAQPVATSADCGSTAMQPWNASLFSEASALGSGRCLIP
jgi:hypothetical protein